MAARASPEGEAVVAHAGHQGGRLGAQEAAACHRGTLGGDSEVGPRPRWSANGEGGIDTALPFSCAEANREKNGGGEKNWGPSALLMGERGVRAVHGAARRVGVRPMANARAWRRRHPVGEAGDHRAWAGWEERWWRVGRCCCGLGPQEQ
jgi:hypothetical protein